MIHYESLSPDFKVFYHYLIKMILKHKTFCISNKKIDVEKSAIRGLDWLQLEGLNKKKLYTLVDVFVREVYTPSPELDDWYVVHMFWHAQYVWYVSSIPFQWCLTRVYRCVRLCLKPRQSILAYLSGSKSLYQHL